MSSLPLVPLSVLGAVCLRLMLIGRVGITGLSGIKAWVHGCVGSVHVSSELLAVSSTRFRVIVWCPRCVKFFQGKHIDSHVMFVAECETGPPLYVCRSCGAYAQVRAVKLTEFCDPGKKSKGAIAKLLKGLHPDHSTPLGRPCRVSSAAVRACPVVAASPASLPPVVGLVASLPGAGASDGVRCGVVENGGPLNSGMAADRGPESPAEAAPCLRHELPEEPGEQRGQPSHAKHGLDDAEVSPQFPEESDEDFGP